MALLFKIIVLAGLYYGASAVGLLLAIPPGYATVFWPASGVALAFVYLYGYRVLPGVFLGSFLVNLLHMGGIETAAFIGLGASLQAYVGAALIRKVIGPETQFRSLKNVLLFNTLSGPVSCLVSASVGVSTLLIAGTLASDNVWFNWWTWYIGDTLGVLIFAPIFILVLSARAFSLRRKMSVIGPLMLVFSIVIALFFIVKNSETRIKYNAFENSAKLIKRELAAEFETLLEAVASLKRFYDSSTYVDRKEFESFTLPALQNNPSLVAFAWAPRVKHSNVDALKLLVEKEGIEDYSLKEQPDDTSFIPVAKRDVYYPILFVEPFEEKRNVMGYDLGSNDARLQTIHAVRDFDRPLATPPVKLVLRDDEETWGFLILQPIYKNPRYPENLRARQDAFQGVVYGVYEYRNAVQKIIQPWQDLGIEVRIKVSADGEYQTAYEVYAENDDALTLSLPYEFAGQEWMFEFYQDQTYLLANTHWVTWYTLLGSLVFTFLTSVFLLSITGQAAQMENIVRQKTKELSTKNKFLNAIMDTVPDLIFVKNKKFEMVQANKAIMEKYPPDERDGVIGSTGLENFPKEEQEIYLLNDKKALAEGYSETIETNTDYENVTRTLFTKKVRFYDDGGEPFILGVARDITEFQATQQKLETILETTAEGLITIRENGIVETYNKACEQIFGYKAKEVIGQNINMLMPEKYARDHGSYLHNYLQTGEKKIIGVGRELEAKRKNGEVFPIDLAVAEVKLGSRRIFSGVIRDISVKKKAQELAEQLSQILDSSLVEFYIFDAESLQFLLANKGAVKNIGHTQEDLLNLHTYQITPNFDEESFREMLEPLRSGEQDLLEFDIQHERKDGSLYDVAVNLQTIQFQGRNAYIAIILDITERKEVIEELQRSNKELENFAYVTSHDLKAPLRHVSMSAGFFQEKFSDQLDDQARELLNVMIEGTGRMQEMIESLLTYARVGRSELNIQRLNLNDVVLAVRQNLIAELHQNAAIMDTEHLPFIYGDRVLMIQLLQNLVQNALKYKRPNTNPVINITSKKGDKYVEVAISDNGIGIDKSYADKVFQIFQRLHPDGEYEGVGIGLSICQRIVEFHGGRIWLDTNYTDGARFVCKLPKFKT